MTPSPRRAGEILQASADYLARKGVDEPRLCAEWLMARLLKCPRLELPLHSDLALEDRLLEAMRRGVQRVGGGEPIQYVLGQTGFMGHLFKTDHRALIPRPETETLVETVLQCEALWKREKPRIVDVGTGSGCIAISLARERKQAVYAALDISADAISLARENAAALGVAEAVLFECADLSDFAEPQTVDAIVSNPPYVSTPEHEKLPVHIRDHEPRAALDGGPDGLAVLTTLIEDAAIVLAPGGFVFLEIGCTQAKAVSGLLESSGFTQICVARDPAGRDRIVSAVLP